MHRPRSQFTPSASYTSELQRLAPAPPGQQWFGYISSQFTSTPAATAATITTRFGLPASADGTPFSSVYAYLVVVGAREADAQNDPNRPVSCGTSLFAINDGSICIDSPAPSDVTSFKTLGGIRDVGVAGLHRLLASLDDITDVDAVVVVAGMEGALASVIGGLVAAPVVAVPTSTGYGAAFEGVTALLAMLSSCASGITVVGIDNGFGAACAVLRFLNGHVRHG